MQRLRDLALQAFSSLWFVPLAIAAAMGAAAFGLLQLDGWIDAEEGRSLALDRHFPLLVGSRVEGARAMLSTSAGALVTVAGVTLSGVLVALSIAAGQYTSRVLRTFTASRTHQAALGVTLGAFVYCLLVLRAVGSTERGDFVPEVSVFVALPLTLASVASLLMFAHGVARSIQASELLAEIANDTVRSAELWFALDGEEEPRPGSAPLQELPPDRIGVPSDRSGYIREVDGEALAAIAEDLDGLIVVEKEVGDFVVAGETVLSIAARRAAAPIEERLALDLVSHLRIGTFRTPEQDPAFGVRQLVDIALKALSPGINDSTTAEMAIHRLVQVLSVPARSAAKPSEIRRGGSLRVVTPRLDFGRLLRLGFEQILRAAADHPHVLATIAEGWCTIHRMAAERPGGVNERALRGFVTEVRALVEDPVREAPPLESSQRVRVAIERVLGASAQD